MLARRLRTLMDELLQPISTPVKDRHFEQRIAALFVQMEQDTALDRAYWGQPWGNKQKFERALSELKMRYLDPRRVHLYGTHGPAQGGFIPPAQPKSVQINIGPHELDYTTPNHDAEYVTLVNPNDFSVDISGWSLRGQEGTISYSFAPGTVIVSGDSLYVSPNIAAFRRRAQSPTGNEKRFAQGNYSGRLSSRPDSIMLVNQRNKLVDSSSYTTPSSPIAGQVDVSEINYDPPKSSPSENTGFSGADFEFIELITVDRRRWISPVSALSTASIISFSPVRCLRPRLISSWWGTLQHFGHVIQA